MVAGEPNLLNPFDKEIIKYDTIDGYYGSLIQPPDVINLNFFEFLKN